MIEPGRYESVVEKQIREAQERGDFDNLPGHGKPLPGLNEPDDDMWWVRRYVEREGLSREFLLPPSVQLRKELDRLPATLRGLPTEQAVRDAVRAVNMRVFEYLRAPSPPMVRVRKVDTEEAVRDWRRHVAPPPAPAPGPAMPPSSRAARTPWWRRWARLR